jgi:predicted membrane protein
VLPNVLAILRAVIRLIYKYYKIIRSKIQISTIKKEEEKKVNDEDKKSREHREEEKVE